MPLGPADPVPPARVRDLAGAAVDLAEVAARGPALLFFYKGDCATSDTAAAVLPRFAAIPGLVLAAISQDTDAETRAFAAAHSWAAPLRVLADAEPWPASDAFAIVSTPTWILAAGGRVIAVEEGWSRAGANALAARAAALAGAPAPVVSRPEDGGPAWRPG